MWRCCNYIDKFPLLFFPNPTGNPKLQFFTITPGKEEGHVALNDETIKTVANLSVAVPYGSGHPLPRHLPTIPTDLKAVGVILCLVIVTHESQERYVDWSHPQLECFKMQAEVLPKATKNLHKKVS